MSKDREIREFYDTASFADELEQATKGDPTVAPTGEAMESFAVRLPAAVLNQVRAQARKEKVSTGAVLRRLIESALNTPAEDKVIPVGELREIIALSAREAAAEAVLLHSPGKSRLAFRSAVDAALREHEHAPEPPKKNRGRRFRVPGLQSGRVVFIPSDDPPVVGGPRNLRVEKSRKGRANT